VLSQGNLVEFMGDSLEQIGASVPP